MNETLDGLIEFFAELGYKCTINQSGFTTASAIKTKTESQVMFCYLTLCGDKVQVSVVGCWHVMDFEFADPLMFEKLERFLMTAEVELPKCGRYY